MLTLFEKNEDLFCQWIIQKHFNSFLFENEGGLIERGTYLKYLLEKGAGKRERP